jgi:hypothetical protein
MENLSNGISVLDVLMNGHFTQVDKYATASGLVVRVSDYRYRGPGCDSQRYQIF